MRGIFIQFLFFLKFLDAQNYKKMAEQQRQSLCPRLIDYLTIVGARSHTVGRSGVGPNPSIQVSFMVTANNISAGI